MRVNKKAVGLGPAAFWQTGLGLVRGAAEADLRGEFSQILS